MHARRRAIETAHGRTGIRRLDQLAATYHPKAIQGDAQAAALVLKIQERRSSLLGTDSPLKVDAVQVRAEAQPRPSATDRILEALEQFAKPVTGDLH